MSDGAVSAEGGSTYPHRPRELRASAEKTEYPGEQTQEKLAF